MPPKEECPNCHQVVDDWHIEWYKSEGPSLYNGLVAMDCPLCGSLVGFEQGKIGPAPPGAPLVRRNADQAAQWAAAQALSAGGLAASGAGTQYAIYWSQHEVQQADAKESEKTEAVTWQS
jgi:hypothetical protein